MFELYINNKLCSLPSKASINMKFKNPAFNKEGVFSYPLSANKDENRAVFEHADAEDNLEVPELKFVLKMNGEPFISGDVTITDTSKAYEFYLKGGKSSVAELLKSSYLDVDINGQSWGDNPNGYDEFINTITGKYPAYNFVVAPYIADDVVVNEFNPDVNGFSPSGNDDITPQVYVRHLINQLIKHSGFAKTRDDFDLFPELNRLLISCPRKDITKDKFTAFKHWLPHITAADFLNCLRNRFNIVAFFNPFSPEVDLVHFDKVFDAPIHDWTSKYIGDADTPAKEKVSVQFTSDGDELDVLSPEQIEEAYQLDEVPTYDDILWEGYYQFKVMDIKRYIELRYPDFDSDMNGVRYINTAAETGWADFLNLSKVFNLIDSPDDDTEARSNDETTPGVENKIFRLVFPEADGKLLSNVHIGLLNARVDSSAGAELIVKAELYDRNAGAVTETLGEERVSLTNTAYEIQSIIINIEKSLPWEKLLDMNGNYISGTYLVLNFYAYHASAARTVTVQFGKVDAPIPYIPYTTVNCDVPSGRLMELGSIGAFNKGDGVKTEKFEPKGKVAPNDINRSGGYNFQMPKLDFKPKKSQKDYAFSFYRGLIPNESQKVNAPYCNFDTLDVHMSDYSDRLTNGDAPSLSLRWHGTNGIINTFWRKTLPWLLYYKRPARKRLQLTQNDLINFKMWHRVKIGNQLYIVDNMPIKALANGELSEATVDLFTI